MKIKELRLLSGPDLIQKIKTLKDDLHKLNEQRYTGRVEKPHLFNLIKKDIARIYTILNEKKEK
jgi:large subunit ribosomal protein L29